jgi:hypothetical protein
MKIKLPGREAIEIRGAVVHESERPPVHVEHRGERFRWVFDDGGSRPMASLEEIGADGLWCFVAAVYADEPLDVARALDIGRPT